VGNAKAQAQLRQGDSSIVRGNEIEFFQQSQDLRARGKVETTLSMAARAGAAEGKSVATASSLEYNDAKRTAIYKGAVTLERTDDETSAEQIVLTLAAASRTLERMDATGGVRTVFQGSRLATGESLLYEAGKDLYTLRGKPLTIWTRDTDGLCSSQGGNYVTLEGALGRASFPPPPANPAGSSLSSNLPCPAGIAPKK
jgi:lipopolysaccharide export system protein LptA